MAWYLVPYNIEQIIVKGGPLKDRVIENRVCAINEYTPLIEEGGGGWEECEISGKRALVKVKADKKVLDALDGVFERLPDDLTKDTQELSKYSGFKKPLVDIDKRIK